MTVVWTLAAIGAVAVLCAGALLLAGVIIRRSDEWR